MLLLEFTQHILPLKDKLFRLALCIVKNKEEAEDIVQDVMMKIWNGKVQLNEIQNMGAYCTTLTKNLAFDRVKRKGFNPLSFQSDKHEISEHKTPFNTMIEDERVNTVHKFINSLPSEKRILIHLRDIEGESYKQISETLNLTEAQVKTNLFRARQELKQLFNNIDL